MDSLDEEAPVEENTILRRSKRQIVPVQDTEFMIRLVESATESDDEEDFDWEEGDSVCSNVSIIHRSDELSDVASQSSPPIQRGINLTIYNASY